MCRELLIRFAEEAKVSIAIAGEPHPLARASLQLLMPITIKAIASRFASGASAAKHVNTGKHALRGVNVQVLLTTKTTIGGNHELPITYQVGVLSISHCPRTTFHAGSASPNSR